MPNTSQKQDNTTIVLFSAQRSGTNHLNYILNQSDEIDAKGEAFNLAIPDNITVSFVDAVNHSGLVEQPFSIKKLKAYDEDECNRWLWLLGNRPDLSYNIYKNKSLGKKYLFFNIFDSQIEETDLSKLFLKNKNIKKIILKRNPIHRYISLEKACKSDDWQQKDSTSLKVSINLEILENEINRHNNFFNYIESAIEKNNDHVLKLSYEKIHSHNTENEKKDYILQKLKQFGVPLKNFNLAGSLPKQDKNKIIEDKIINYDELYKFLKKKNLTYLLEEENIFLI